MKILLQLKNCLLNNFIQTDSRFQKTAVGLRKLGFSQGKGCFLCSAFNTNAGTDFYNIDFKQYLQNSESLQIFTNFRITVVIAHKYKSAAGNEV